MQRDRERLTQVCCSPRPPVSIPAQRPASIAVWFVHKTAATAILRSLITQGHHWVQTAGPAGGQIASEKGHHAQKGDAHNDGHRVIGL